MLTRRQSLLVLKLAISLGLLGLLYRNLDWTSFLAVLREARTWILIPLFALLLLNTGLSAFKWRLLLAADGLRRAYWDLFAVYWIASFFNLFLPSSIGGDAYRVVALARESRRGAASFASVLADRLTGFLAVAAWGLVFSAVGHRQLPRRELAAVPGMVFIVLVLVIAVLTNRWTRGLVLQLWPLPSDSRITLFLHSVLNSVDSYVRSPRLLLWTMAISLTFQGSVILAVWLMSRLLAWSVPLLYFCMLVPLITLVEAVPLSIFGLGLRDAAYVVLFTPLGVAREQALALPLVYVVLTAIYAGGGGVLFVLRRHAVVPAVAPQCDSTT